MNLKRIAAEATAVGALGFTILVLGTGVANAVPSIPWPQDIGGGNFGGGNFGGGNFGLDNWVPDINVGNLVPDIGLDNWVPDINVGWVPPPPYVGGGCVCGPGGCSGQC
jgi:hypothetical protein